MINLEKESEEYARKMWGEYFDNTYDESCNMLSYGEVCQKDFKAGIEFAQKGILVSEELPEKKNHGFTLTFHCIADLTLKDTTSKKMVMVK